MCLYSNTLQEEYKLKVGQLNSELSEMNSQMMVKEKELTKLKKENKQLIEQFSGRKEVKKETIPQVHTLVYTNPKIKQSTLH